ncbi:MAG: carboxypeptidase regulatory-like domain-containing protein, partial [Acidobacteria bacterium]|nr:carboxypeptidase regulatory-like domain-containing protein [Acidobacteriota bacterium]
MFRGALYLLLITTPAFAQTGQGTIVGQVTDTTSGIVPGVAVRVQHTGTGFTYNGLTNEEGIYRVQYLNPGTYEIAYEAQGFKKLVRSNIVVRSTETARVDVVLEIGQMVDSIEVKAEAPLLETETSTVGHLVSGDIRNRLPTPQQKIQSILWYMPGVTSQRGDGHIAGQRSRAFVAAMDGVSGMEPVRGEVATNRFLATVEHNMDEIKVMTTALPAEYGHSGGGIMNISYKSGTNQFHGLAEERYLSKKQIHRNWQDPNIPLGNFGYHMMTGTLSGPVIIPGLYDGHNKTFFLIGFQRHHEKASEDNQRTVPSPAMLAGDFSFGGIGDPIYDPATLVRLPNGTYSRTQFPGNRIPVSRFDPVAVKFLSFNPYALENNRFNQMFINRTGPVNNLSADTVYRSYRTGTDYKIDHSFSDNHKIFGRLSNYRHRSFTGRWQVQYANPIFDYNYTPI